MPAPFSRLQLAAALIEYDNDSEDPSKPRRSAQESAVFLPFRNRPLRPPAPERRSTDYLGVNLPSETGSIAPRESLAWDRKSRASIDALRNPFGRDSTYDGLDMEEEEDDLEVDLASWGLDALVDKDKEKEKAKQRKRTKSETLTDNLPNPYERVGRAAKPHARTQSMNLLNGLGDGGAFLDSAPGTPAPALGPRRHSIGDPLDAPLAYSNEPILPPRARSPSVHALIDNLPLSAPLHSVPFPSSETVRSPSPQVGERSRTLSLGSRAMMLNDEPEHDNPFAVRPPSPSRMSRFDPKVQQRARTLSHGTMATQMMLDDIDPEPDTYAHDPRPPRERRYSRIELMRPKVLIMPSPLQSAPRPEPKQDLRATDGFELSTDGRPLPFGAKAARRSSVTLSVLDPSSSHLAGAAPVASNSFTPNPRSSLTLSQLTFRNTLLVDGQRDVAYADIEGRLKRATEDGQQIEDEPEPEPEPEPQPEVPIVQVEEPTGPKRPAGKLYGKSLIDDLEARKAQMRGKQRVFRGDDRPSMMARTQTQRSSTLIAPDELKRPASQHLNSFNSAPGALSRRNSANVKTLLAFEDEIPGAPRQSLHPGGGVISSTRSVFGVDTLWERELAKLKAIEEQERKEAEERARREAEEEARNPKKGKKKKGKGKEKDEAPVTPQSGLSPSPSSAQVASPAPGGVSVPDAPPVLPDIPRAIVRRAPPPPGDDSDDSDDDSDASDAPAPPRAQQASGWHSDEDEGPRRTAGTGPRYPISSSGGPPRLPQIARPGDDSSEEDVPLVATIGRAAQRLQARSTAGGDDSSDEEQPLSVLLDKTKQKLPSMSVSGGSLSPRSPALRAGADDDGDDEDDKPLGLRVSRAFGTSLNPSSGRGDDDDDDDKPLALHPDQVRKSQFYMAQAQQQMLAQAQMAQMAAAAQQSMIFGAPSMMGSGFFGPPMAAAAPIMAYPQLPPTPPPMQDAVKLGRVDKWRHDVAVEGQR
ncbi:hypothetical protein BD309DRAFT_74135 [Dichomitus squalens]|uniref:Uncharacterized protein n=1 Tax=Dichomitus squalens TaxID=114155 RepID=A0A4Q9P976_9APHY|nr:hypothetical protein BD309DRAFT_74135 [Dichomitus squalens]TBU64032.1 hypothetical protein BD310DRAFT_868063 [Dichomitus squalens]